MEESLSESLHFAVGGWGMRGWGGGAAEVCDGGSRAPPTSFPRIFLATLCRETWRRIGGVLVFCFAKFPIDFNAQFMLKY